jgi:transposase
MDAIVVGIDVSTDRLDVAVRPSGESFAVSRDASGLGDLINRLKPLTPQVIAFDRRL